MDNQHRKIAGYRELSQVEIDLMNRIKAHAELTRSLVDDIRNSLAEPLPEIVPNDVCSEALVCAGAALEDVRWIGIGEDHLQQGFMALTRAVAKPTTF